jgi:tetratricopeptide (TPR) repeat protein
VSTISVADEANSALDLALEQPHVAMVRAEHARQAATAAGLDAEEAVALRALGLAARSLQQITRAKEYLTQAVEAAGRAGDRDLQAECLGSLAGALVFGGEGPQALATLDAASPGPKVAGFIASQRAGILAMLGRYDDALRQYDKIVRSHQQSGDRLAESWARNNRGLLYVHTGRFRQADADLARAQRIAASLGNLAQVADCQHNRGFAAGRRGDLPTSLAMFDQAERVKAEANLSLDVLRMSRAEALVSAGLIHEARALLERAIATMRAGGERFVLAEGLALLADTAHLAEDFEAALSTAGEAIALFADQERAPQVALAQVTASRAVLSMNNGSGPDARAASQTATTLDSLRLATSALAAHAVAGKLWLALSVEPNDDYAHRAQEELARAAKGRHRGRAADRAVAWDAEGVRRLAAGDRRGAQTALKAAVAVVDAQQAALSATELRAHISLHTDGSAALGLRLAIEDGRARPILDWMERRRANSLRSWPVRPPRDEVLAGDLAQLRRLASEMNETTVSGGDPRPLARQVAQLERRVRERAWQLSGTEPSAPSRSETTASTRQVAEALESWALVELGDSGGELHAVVVAGGRCSYRPLGPTTMATSELEHLRFGLRRAAYGIDASRSAPLDRGAGRQSATPLEQAATRLDQLLLAPLRPLLQDRPVIVVPTGALHAVPWSALPTLAGRPLTIAPSAHAWLRATRTEAVAGPMLGVAGPDLRAATTEIKGLRKIYPDATTLTGRRATARAVLAHLEGASVANIAAHATLNADNGLWSALRLADGPLTVYELEGLTRAPSLVVLSACQSGLSTVRSGDEVLGLVASLLALGTRTVVASVLPIDDQATAPLILDFHARLAAGDSPAVALAGAQVAAADPVVAASFVCFGAS